MWQAQEQKKRPTTAVASIRVPISRNPAVGSRPTQAKGPVGYTVNKARASLRSIDLPEKRRRDDKGHIVAARFNGVDRAENLVPMNRRLNQRGAWYREETRLATAYKRQLKDAVLAGKTAVAEVEVKLNYDTGNPGRRPNSLDLKWHIKQARKQVASGQMSTASNR